MLRAGNDLKWIIKWRKVLLHKLVHPHPVAWLPAPETLPAPEGLRFIGDPSRSLFSLVDDKVPLAVGNAANKIFDYNLIYCSCNSQVILKNGLHFLYIYKMQTEDVVFISHVKNVLRHLLE